MLALIIIVRYVFLDRDGVLNRKMPEGVYVGEWAQFEWLPGAVEAVARMKRAGLTVIVVSNQRGIALGRITTAQLAGVHEKMQDHLARNDARLDAIYYCPHDYGECHCRKPDTGLFEQAFQIFPQANVRKQRGHRRFSFRHSGRPTAGHENHLHPGRAGSPEGRSRCCRHPRGCGRRLFAARRSKCTLGSPRPADEQIR